jgi:hypothetical protein
MGVRSMGILAHGRAVARASLPMDVRSMGILAHGRA